MCFPKLVFTLHDKTFPDSETSSKRTLDGLSLVGNEGAGMSSGRRGRSNGATSTEGRGLSGGGTSTEGRGRWIGSTTPSYLPRKAKLTSFAEGRFDASGLRH